MQPNGRARRVLEAFRPVFEHDDIPPQFTLGWWYRQRFEEIAELAASRFSAPDPAGSRLRSASAVWGTRPDPRDLSAIDDWPTFVREMNATILHLWATLRVHGHMAVLVGDIARHGAIQSMQHELAWCGTPIRTIIKVQHNARSYRATYRGSFVPVVHEYLLVFRKDQPYGVRVVYTVTRQVDLRRRNLTWLQIVQAAVEALGGRVDLKAVYHEVARQFGERVAQAQWWHEKVRQVLQGQRFVRLERGVYGLA